jgi:hypothetical protein
LSLAAILLYILIAGTESQRSLSLSVPDINHILSSPLAGGLLLIGFKKINMVLACQPSGIT